MGYVPGSSFKGAFKGDIVPNTDQPSLYLTGKLMWNFSELEPMHPWLQSFLVAITLYFMAIIAHL